MTVIYEDLDLPDTSTPWPAEVRIRLAGAQGRPVLGRKVTGGGTIVGETLLRTGNGINNAGFWQLDLHPNADILPAGTTWRVQRSVPACQEFVTFINVPVTGGPFEASSREDDPLGEITPSALSSHASDLALHGGGIEVAFASINTAITVTGSSGGFVNDDVAGLIVTIPDLARPVYLFGHIPAQQAPGGPADAGFGIYPQGALGLFSALDAASVPDLDPVVNRHVELFARLAAHTPGDFVVAGSGNGGNFTAVVNGTVLSLASLRAVAA